MEGGGEYGGSPPRLTLSGSPTRRGDDLRREK